MYPADLHGNEGANAIKLSRISPAQLVEHPNDSGAHCNLAY